MSKHFEMYLLPSCQLAFRGTQNIELISIKLCMTDRNKILLNSDFTFASFTLRSKGLN
jgi:hypothetical protein